MSCCSDKAKHREEVGSSGLSNMTLQQTNGIMGKRERVYGVVGYYDGVLDGVADFGGTPHAFVLDQDLDAPTPIYRLARLSPDTMKLFDESWQIWRRWERANPQPKPTPDLVAALPQDRARHDEIEPQLKERLAVPIESALRARGTFMQRADVDIERDGRWAMDVEWSDP